MIKTAQEGLEGYKATLRKYNAWTDELTKRYDAICGKGKWSPMANFTNADYEEVN